MGKFCGQCGAPLNENAKFCRGCGTPVAAAAQQPSTQRRMQADTWQPTAPIKKKGGWILPYRIVATVLIAAMIATGTYGVIRDRDTDNADESGFSIDAGTVSDTNSTGPDSPAPAIVSYGPDSGAAGSLVQFKLDKTVDAASLQVSYSGVPVNIEAAVGDAFIVNVPHDATSGEFSVSYGGDVASASFEVEPQTLMELSRVTAQPSGEAQTIECAEGVTVTLPGDFLDQPRDVILSRVINPAVTRDMIFAPMMLYDIKIDGLTSLPDYVEVSLPLDAASFSIVLSEYDPSGSLTLEDVMRAQRWNEELGVMVNLPMSIDEAGERMYFLTDHFSLLGPQTLFSVARMVYYANAGYIVDFLSASKDVIVTACKAINEAYHFLIIDPLTDELLDWDKFANTIYITRDKNFNIFWPGTELELSLPEKDWDNCAARGGFTRDPYDGPAAVVPHLVADVGAVLEESLKSYVNAGFSNPAEQRGIADFVTTIAPREYKRGIDVRIDSSSALKQGDPHTSMFSGVMHLPTEVFKSAFNADSSMPGYGAKKFTTILAHELFHIIQRDTYGSVLGTVVANALSALGTPGALVGHKWWLEATAEYAAADIACGLKGSYLNENIGAAYPTAYIDSTGQIAGAYYKDAEEYDYLTGIFVRFLVDEAKAGFPELFKSPSKSLIVSNAVTEFAAGKSGKFTADNIYTGFIEYLVDSTSFSEALGKDLDRRKLSSAFARRVDVVDMESPEDGNIGSMVVNFTIEENGADGGAGNDVLVYRATADGRLEFVAKANGPDEYRFTAEYDNVFYFVVPNNTGEERRPAITLFTEDQSAPDGRVTLLEHRFMGALKISITGLYTEAWAVYFGRSNWQVSPGNADPVIKGQPEAFTLTGHYLDPAITHVVVEWDFGDGQGTTPENAPLTLSSYLNSINGGTGGGYGSTGSVVVAVSGNEVDLEFIYTFTDPPDVPPNLNRANWTYMPRFKIYKSDAGGVKGAELSERIAFVNVLLFNVLVPDLVRYNPVFDWIGDEDAGGMTLYLNATGYPNDNGMEYRYEWDFGDGAIYSQTAEPGKKAKTGHCYKSPGDYTLTVTMYDESGLLGAAPLAKREHKFTLGEPVVKEEAPAPAPDTTGTGVFTLNPKIMIPISRYIRGDREDGYRTVDLHTANGTWCFTYVSRSTDRRTKVTSIATERYSVTFSGLPGRIKAGDTISINVNITSSNEYEDIYFDANINGDNDRLFRTSDGATQVHSTDGSISYTLSCEIRELDAKYGFFNVNVFVYIAAPPLIGGAYLASGYSFKYEIEGHGEVTMPDYIEQEPEPEAFEGDMIEMPGRYEGIGELYHLAGYFGPPELNPAVTGANKKELALDITEEDGKYYCTFFSMGSGGWRAEYSKAEIISFDPVTGRFHTEKFLGWAENPASPEYRFSGVFREDRIVDGHIEPIDRNREFDAYENIELTRR